MPSFYCAIIGRNDNDIFPVDINEARTVDELKGEIKKKAKTTGPAHTVTLYQVNIDISSDEACEQAMEAISQSATCSEAMGAIHPQLIRAIPHTVGDTHKGLNNPSQELSTFLPSTPAKGTIYILVKLPQATTPPNESSSTPKLDNDIQRNVQMFIPYLRKVLEIFLKNNVQLPLWQLPSNLAKYLTEETRSHITGLKMPITTFSSETPSLLLHNLGERSHDAKLVDRINELFDPGLKTQFLCNASGSGKTRLLLEGLSRNWGFYFTARTEPDGIGSSDLGAERRDLKLRLMKITDENCDIAMKNNEVLARRRFLLLLYVRCVCFRVFLECAAATTGWITNGHKLRWLLIQLAPVTLLMGPDIFWACTQLVGRASIEYLERGIQQEFLCINAHLPQPSPLFCVLDEAHNLTENLNSFRTKPVPPTFKPGPPILCEVIRSWRSMLPHLIVSGTGIPMQAVASVINPVVAKEGGRGPTDMVTEVGGFDDEEGRRAYLEQYFPPGFLDTSQGKKIVSRVGYWLRGRHCFIATYLSRLIQTGFQSPHRVLNDFVFGMTDSRPSDWDDDDDGTPLTVELGSFYGFNFDALLYSELYKPELLTTLAGFVFEYTLTGEIRGLGGNLGADMVDFGVSRFKTQLKEQVAETDEPLAILGLVTFFQRKGQSLLKYLRIDLNASNAAYRGITFEHYVAYLLVREFSDPTPLSEVFNFVEGGEQANEALQDKLAELVALEKVGDSFQTTPVRFKTHSWSSHVLGCSRLTVADSFEWLQNPQGFAFCFPPKAVGGDLMFALRLTGDNTILRVSVEFNHAQEMSPQDWGKATRTTDLSRFSSQKTKDNRSSTGSNPSMRGELEKAIKNLGNGTKQAAPCGLLRVVCSYPSLPDSDELEKAAATGRHSLATVAVRLLKPDESDLGQAIKSLSEQAQHALHNPDRKRKRSDEIEGVSFKRQ